MKLPKISLPSVVTVVALLVVAGAIAVVSAYSGGAPKYLVEGDLNVTETAPVEEPSLGAFPGDEVYTPIRFANGFAQRVLATSSAGSATTLNEADLTNYDVFEFTSTMSNFTYTFPSTSTLSSILQNVGDTRKWIFRNHNTSTSATTLTLAKGNGWDLTGVDANPDLLAAYSWGVVECYRESPSSTVATFGTGTSYSQNSIMCEIRELIAVD